jgi:hypothetical protein
MKQLSKVIPLIISSKLQDQIYFLCSKIPNDEWSGVLFYNTEGKFGEEGFKIICEELFPLDIGTSTYTEYETGDPDFIKFMMSNPAILDMKKGHIHSHNRMDTFFSGTDTSELRDNAPNHNIYVSLIVNNRNDNCAKLAFLASERIVREERIIVTESKTIDISFKDENGNEIIKHFDIPKNTDNINKSDDTKEVIYVHDCNIVYPSTVGGALTARFQQLCEAVKKREDERRAKYAHTPNSYLPGEGYGYRGGYAEKRAWNQPDIFNTHSKADGQVNASKEGENRRLLNNSTSAVKSAIIIPPGVSGKSLLKEIENGNYKTVNGTAPKSSALHKNIKQTIYLLTGKLLALDFKCSDPIQVILNRLNKAFYPSGIRNQDQRVQSAAYYDDITRRCLSFYRESFPNDKKNTSYQDTMRIVIEIISSFDTSFPELIENIVEAIKDTFRANEVFN